MVGIILGIGVFGNYLYEKNIQCPRYSKNTELESKYDLWAGGCFVNYEGQWIPMDNLRAGKLD